MLTRCTHCSTEYVLEDASIPATGLSLQCSECNQVFGVLPTQGPPAAASTWQVRLLSGAIYEPGDLATLQRWIIERRLGRDDLLTQDGSTWQRLGNIPDLGPFFAAVPDPNAEIRMAPPPVRPAPTQPVILPTAPPMRVTPPARPSQPAMPVLSNQNYQNDSSDYVTLPGGLDIQRRTTGRRRTESRSTLDNVFEEKPGPSAFSFPMDLPEDDDPVAHQRRGRASRWFFVALLVLGSAGSALYLFQPEAVAGLVAQVRRAPVADAAVQQVQAGYEALDRDSMSSIQAAMGAFDRANRVDNRYADARAGQAEAELALAESYQQAAEDLERYAASLSKRDKLRRAGQITDQKQEATLRSDRALTAAKDALTLAPESAAANRALAHFYCVRGAEPGKIQPLLDRARAAAPQDTHLLYVQALAAERDPARAVGLYQEAIAAAPQLNHARYRLARLFMANNNPTGALQQVEAILRNAPDHELAQALLQKLQPTAGAPAGAQVAELPAPSPSPATPVEPTPAANNAPKPTPGGLTNLPARAARPAPAAPESNSPQAPVQDVTPPTSEAPSPSQEAAPSTNLPRLAKPAEPSAAVDVAAGLGAAKQPGSDLAETSYAGLIDQGQQLRAKHDMAAASAVYQRAVSKEPANPRGYVGLGWCALEQNDAETAVTNFTLALQRGPRQAETHFGLAEAYRAKGARRDAQKHYREYLSITPDGPLSQVARRMLEELSK